MLRVGTSGWGRQDWLGPFYPVSLRDRPEAWLAYYAERFSAVEITSTFDTFPDEELLAAWTRIGTQAHERGPFEFSVKLPAVISHRAMLRGDADAAREWTGRFDREVLDPLDGEGLLGAVLIQLSPRMPPSAHALTVLRRVIGALAERRVALELRHPDWCVDGKLAAVAEELLSSPDVTLVTTDHPSLPSFEAPEGSAHAYVRLHGRVPDGWGVRGTGAIIQDGARYDDLYDDDAIAEVAARARSLCDGRRQTRVFFNNGPAGKAVANAASLSALLGVVSTPANVRVTEQTRLRL